eukprot:SAG11_NODE_2895_length_2856_cov_2.924946_5_plen_51_part_00
MVSHISAVQNGGLGLLVARNTGVDTVDPLDHYSLEIGESNAKPQRYGSET